MRTALITDPGISLYGAPGTPGVPIEGALAQMAAARHPAAVPFMTQHSWEEN